MIEHIPGDEILDPRIYEIGLLLVPILGDEGAQNRFGQLKKRLGELGATGISEGEPERIDLAYRMQNTVNNKKAFYGEAYFCWYKFEINPSVIATVETELKADTVVLRSLLFKTVRENTYIQRKTRRRTYERTADEVLHDELTATADSAIIAPDADVVDDLDIATLDEKTETVDTV